MLRRLWMLIPALLLTLAACGHGGGTDEPKPVDNPVRIQVNNNYALPIEIYAVGSAVDGNLTVIVQTITGLHLPATR